MADKSNLVVLLGGGLLVANVLYDQTFSGLRSEASSGKATSTDVDTSPVKMILVGLLTLFVLSALADTSDSMGNAILIILFSLWVVWLMAYETQKKGTSNNA